MQKNNKFSYLLNNEINRGKKILLTVIIGLMLLTILCGIYDVLNINNTIKILTKEGKNVEEILSIAFNNQFIAPINRMNYLSGMQGGIEFLIGATILLCYSAFCWYREWFGSNKTIYSLMMLPISKSKIILSKLITIMIYLCILISTQIVAIFINYKIFYAILPKEFIEKINFLTILKKGELSIIGTEFGPIEIMLFSISVILIIFTAVFIERFIKGKGLIISVIYGCIYIALYTYVPFKLLTLFSLEIEIYFIIVPLISIITNFCLGKYLLENKVSV